MPRSLFSLMPPSSLSRRVPGMPGSWRGLPAMTVLVRSLLVGPGFMITLLAAFAPAGAQAQANDEAAHRATVMAELRPGDRVRIRDPAGRRTIMTVTSVTPELLGVRLEEGDSLTLDRASVTRLERSDGRRRGAMKPFLVGVSAGAALGGLVAAMAWQPPQCSGDASLTVCWGFGTRGEAVRAGSASGALFGGMVGALSGLRTREHWVRIPWTSDEDDLSEPRLRAGVSVGPTGAIELGFRVGSRTR